jgi:hypothetical protein
MEPDGSSQSCPACGLLIDVSQAEALAKVACPECGEKFRVERAFDNFALLETLGVGGMGSVYKARDTRLNRSVALKLLRPELSADPAEIARLEQEARATAAVNDPHVVQVFSSGTDHGQFYLVMELVDQGSLDDRMAEQGRVPEAAVLDTGIQVARGLRAAQEQGLIHRDVKPGNILFADDHTAKIGDFGLAVASGQDAESQNEIWGTPYYVAPERLNHQPEDFRSDLYSLGATLYHAIAGRPPFEGETNSATALRDFKNNPLSLGAAAPGLRKETVRTIDRMIAPDPEKRFASYDELIAALEQARDALNPKGRKARRRRLLIAALFLLVALGAGGFYFYQKFQTERQIEAERLAKVKATAKSGEETLQRLYDDARRELIAGKYDAARTTFARLAGEAHGHAQLLAHGAVDRYRYREVHRIAECKAAHHRWPQRRPAPGLALLTRFQQGLLVDVEFRRHVRRIGLARRRLEWAQMRAIDLVALHQAYVPQACGDGLDGVEQVVQHGDVGRHELGPGGLVLIGCVEHVRGAAQSRELGSGVIDVQQIDGDVLHAFIGLGYPAR